MICNLKSIDLDCFCFFTSFSLPLFSYNKLTSNTMTNLIKTIAISVALFFGVQNVRSQSFSNPFEKITFGGNIGVGISSDYWNIGITPQVGYRVTENFQVGVGIGYQYRGNKDDDIYYSSDRYKYKYSESSVSFNVFARYFPIKFITLSVRPEIMRTWYSETIGENKYKDNKFAPAVIVGAGIYAYPTIFEINYELVQDKYSPYSKNVFFSAGFSF